MSIDSDLFDKRTDKLVELLKADTLLDRDLPSGVTVYKSPQKITTENHVIFIWRMGIDDYEYRGLQQVRIEATWAIAALTRKVGDPEELERQISILAANIVRHFMDNIQVANFWQLALLQSSSADTVRTVEGQTWELELIPVQLTFEEDF